MNKSIWVGIGCVAAGLAAIATLRFIGIDFISTGVVGGIMATMVIVAAQRAYELGKKDGVAALRTRLEMA